MQIVTSRDGSRIAYDRYGSGPVVILVAGALGYRKFKQMEELATLLAGRCTVINYDRRGRGDSTEVKPCALEREIEDIAALIEAADGSASLRGWSSGGALALRAAGAGLAVERLSVYEVPFMVTPDAKRPTPDYGERLDALVAAGDRNGAVTHFMRNSMGIPAPVVALMRLMPMWKGLKATAHTLPYDWAALGRHTMYGAPLSADEWAAVTVPRSWSAAPRARRVARRGRHVANLLRAEGVDRRRGGKDRRAREESGELSPPPEPRTALLSARRSSARPRLLLPTSAAIAFGAMQSRGR
jgi:hypothetical protein